MRRRFPSKQIFWHFIITWTGLWFIPVFNHVTNILNVSHLRNDHKETIEEVTVLFHNVLQNGVKVETSSCEFESNCYLIWDKVKRNSSHKDLLHVKHFINLQPCTIPLMSFIFCRTTIEQWNERMCSVICEHVTDSSSNNWVSFKFLHTIHKCTLRHVHFPHLQRYAYVRDDLLIQHMVLTHDGFSSSFWLEFSPR